MNRKNFVSFILRQKCTYNKKEQTIEGVITLSQGLYMW